MPTITGTVVDAGKQPIAGCAVHARCGSRGDEAASKAVSDAQGRFTLLVHAGDEVSFKVQEKGCAFEVALEEPRGVRVGARDVALVIPDSKRASSWISGRVAGADGRPLADVNVGITDGVWVPREFDKAKPDGSFRFGPLFAGEVWVALVPQALGAP